MEKENNGLMLNFGTGEIGRSSMIVNFANDWLNITFYITADRGTTTMFVSDIEREADLVSVDNAEISELDDLDFNTLDGFNKGIKEILIKVIEDDLYEDKESLGGFSLIGLKLDI